MKRVLVAVTAIGMLVTVGLISSSNADSGKTTIYACSTARNGYLVKVSYDPVTCPAGTSPISWSTGAQGPRGDTGPKGDKGDQGEPGYSYGEVLASGNDETSKVWAFNPGDGCTGNLFKPWKNASGDTYYCARELDNVNEIMFLSALIQQYSAGHLGTASIFLLAEGCPPNTREGLAEFSKATQVLLVSGMQPVKYSISAQKMCLAYSYQYYTQGQVVVETN